MNLNPFNPQSIAVIGASANKKKLGYQLLKNLIDTGFEGGIYPVNLEEKKILNHKTYNNVLDIHAKIDFATIIVPREIVPQVVSQCIHKGVNHVLIISAGFAEKDSEGVRLQEKLKKLTVGSSTKIIGPNCLGLINTENKLNLTFAASGVQPGGIGLVLQSGAIGAAVLDWAKEKRLGISKFVSLGNKLQFNEIDAIKLLGDDPQTKMIGLYLEEISDPVKFLRTCRQVTPKKPIIILKGGVTKRGAKAASSHTAALATSQVLDKAIFSQANLIDSENFSEFLNFFEFFSCKNFDSGRRLAIVSNAGGPSILAADAASKSGFSLPSPTRKERSVLENKLSSYASLDNPFDLGGDALAETYEKVIEDLEKSPNFSSILAIVTPQTMTEIEKTAHVIGRYRKSPKPVVATFLGGKKIKPAEKILAKMCIPHFSDPSLGIKMLAKIHLYYDKTQKKKTFLNIEASNYHQLMENDELIKKYKIPFVKSERITSDSEALAFVEENDFPVAFKTDRPIKYKGRSGKVGLNISDDHGLVRSIRQIGYPAIIQKMVDSPYEVLIGARRDPFYGIALVFGQGGIFVEENADIATKILPLTAADIDEMIEQTKVWQQIRQYRVKTVLKDLIIKVAKLITENTDISSVEFNPFKVLNGKIIAVDIHVERDNG